MSESYHAAKINPISDTISAIDSFPNCTQEDLIKEIDSIKRSSNPNDNLDEIIRLSDLKSRVLNYSKSYESGKMIA